ncbi:MAG TPA: hypothetical protein GXX54_06790 [Clostridiales bacterium]|nr:hypothetical protein [Clostridiales bacterium]
MIPNILNINKNNAASLINSLSEAKKEVKSITGLSKSTDNLDISEQTRMAMFYNAVAAAAGTKITVDSDSHDVTKKKANNEEYEEGYNQNDSADENNDNPRQKAEKSNNDNKEGGRAVTYPGKPGSIIDVKV